MDYLELLLDLRTLLSFCTLYFYYGSYGEAAKVQKKPWAFLFFMGWAIAQIITRVGILTGVLSDFGVSFLVTIASFLQVLGAYYLKRIMTAEIGEGG